MKMKFLALAIMALGITMANAQDSTKTHHATTTHKHHVTKHSSKTTNNAQKNSTNYKKEASKPAVKPATK